jgi:hypothetical protein
LSKTIFGGSLKDCYFKDTDLKDASFQGDQLPNLLFYGGVKILDNIILKDISDVNKKMLSELHGVDAVSLVHNVVYLGIDVITGYCLKVQNQQSTIFRLRFRR